MNEHRFLADAMLAGLVRWLRVLDYDTRYDPVLDDPALVRLAAAEERTLLTRDRHLVTFLRPARVLLITHDAPMRQLREVIHQCALQPPPVLFARCLVCNTRQREASAHEAATGAPDSAHGHGDRILFCVGCSRVYWEGSHTRRMRHQLAEALPEWFAAGPLDT